MNPSPDRLWALVDELQTAQKNGQVPLIDAIEQIYKADDAVESVVAMGLENCLEPQKVSKIGIDWRVPGVIEHSLQSPNQG